VFVLDLFLDLVINKIIELIRRFFISIYHFFVKLGDFLEFIIFPLSQIITACLLLRKEFQKHSRIIVFVYDFFNEQLFFLLI